MRIEHRLREKHFNADGLSKKTEFYDEREEYDRSKPAIASGFSFMNQEAYDRLETVPWLNKDGNEIPDEEKMEKTESLRTLKRDQAKTVERDQRQNDEAILSENSLNKTERLTLAKIAKADSPFVAAVMRDDEPVIEPRVTHIVKFSPGCVNAAEQEGAEAMIRALRLVNAATYSVADLKRAQQTDLVTLALKRCFEHGSLEGTPWKCKELGDDGCLLDPEVRKIVNDFYKQWKPELYVNYTRRPLLQTKIRGENL